ncbi:MAG: hypothetical protein JWO94_732 [Verrucomicrobiaceae bacterium]|nr:hypothetical protein [Verrucomicrobiaceae bacterium]
MPNFSSITQLVVSPPLVSADAGGHTLVCVFLRGGADTMNLVVPYADDHYYNARPTLAVKRPGSGADAAIRLDEHYAFHPVLKPLEAAFKEGRLGMVQGVGTDSTSGSHFECQDQMEHGDSELARPAGGGWLGRFLRLRAGEATPSPLSAVAIGTKLPESLRGAPSVSVLEHLDDIAIKAPSGHPEAVVGALRRMYGADVTLLGQRGQQTLDLFNRMSILHGRSYTPANGADYPRHPFGEGLRELARLIKLGVGLEVACIDLSNWDTHFLQGTVGGHTANAKVLAESLAAFETDLKAERARYTVMITTEFGRRVYENASAGTDHGRGFTFMALGDKVKGGRILGGWPIGVMDETNPLGPGGVDIQHDFRDVFAEVLSGAMGTKEGARIFPGASLSRVGLMVS